MRLCDVLCSCALPLNARLQLQSGDEAAKAVQKQIAEDTSRIMELEGQHATLCKELQLVTHQLTETKAAAHKAEVCAADLQAEASRRDAELLTLQARLSETESTMLALRAENAEAARSAAELSTQLQEARRAADDDAERVSQADGEARRLKAELKKAMKAAQEAEFRFDNLEVRGCMSVLRDCAHVWTVVSPPRLT